MSRTLVSIVLVLVAKAATAQPFIYSIKGQSATCTAGSPCNGPHLAVTNVRTGEWVNPDDPELFPGTDGPATGIRVSPDGLRVYVLVNPLLRGITSVPGRLVVVSTVTNRPVLTMTLPYQPFMMTPSPDGQLLYVSSPLSGAIVVIDPVAGKIVRTVRVPGAFAMDVSTDGAVMAVAAVGGGLSEIDIFDTTAWTRRLAVTLPQYPERLAIARDGSKVFVTTQLANAGSIVTIDTTTGVVETRGAGAWLPYRLLVAPDDSKVYVTFALGGGWGVLFPDGTLAVHAASVPGQASMVASEDWSHVYVEGNDGIIVIDTASDSVETVLPGGSNLSLSAGSCQFAMPPQDVTFGPAGGAGTITIPAPAGCAWTVQNTPPADLLTFTSATSGVGPSTLTYTLGPSTVARAATIRVAQQNVQVSITVPRLFIDAPRPGLVVHAPFVVAGWTLNEGVSASTTGIDAVHAWAFPAAGGTPVWLGTPAYGAARPDVGGVFGSAYTNSGFNLVVPWLAPGTYWIAVYGHNPVLGFAASQAVLITVVAERGMALDLPADNITVDASNAAVVIAGWAFDGAAQTGSGIDAIHVWAFPAADGTPRFLGVAPYGFSRPDVGAYYGARFDASGFGAALLKPPPGTYWLAVYAHSTVTGQFDQVRVVRITVAPAP